MGQGEESATPVKKEIVETQQEFANGQDTPGSVAATQRSSSQPEVGVVKSEPKENDKLIGLDASNVRSLQSTA